MWFKFNRIILTTLFVIKQKNNKYILNKNLEFEWKINTRNMFFSIFFKVDSDSSNNLPNRIEIIIIYNEYKI